MFRALAVIFAVTTSLVCHVNAGSETTRYISPCGDDAWGGLTPDCGAQPTFARPKRTIQNAIDASSNGDKIVVLPGTYNERINFLGKALGVRSQDGPWNTTIDATGIPGSAVVLDIVPPTMPELRGFTVTGGTGEVLPGFGNLRGGGLRISAAINARIVDCIFRDNNVGSACCTLGGGIYAENGAQPTIINCIIHDNSPEGFHSYQADAPTLINCTLSDNDHCGILANGNSIYIRNTISWGNDWGGTCGGGATAFFVSNSCFNGASPVNGNINADPLFVDPAAGDFRLQAGSPTIDTGNNSFVPSDILEDVAGHVRLVDGDGVLAITVDMGAHEFQVDLCPADIAPIALGDGAVDIDDLLQVLSSWGPCSQPCSSCIADINGDCSVDVDDLIAVIGAWGPCS